MLDQVSYLYPHSDQPALSNIARDPLGELGRSDRTGAGKTTLCLALNGVVPQFYGGGSSGARPWPGSIPSITRSAGSPGDVAVVFEDPRRPDHGDVG